jgi:hypothetical protein
MFLIRLSSQRGGVLMIYCPLFQGACWNAPTKQWYAPSGVDVEDGPLSRWIPQRRTNLYVAYSEKDDAKALGARWDPEMRRWYCPPGMALEPFARWLVPNAAWRSQESALIFPGFSECGCCDFDYGHDYTTGDADDANEGYHRGMDGKRKRLRTESKAASEQVSSRSDRKGRRR